MWAEFIDNKVFGSAKVLGLPIISFKTIENETIGSPTLADAKTIRFE